MRYEQPEMEILLFGAKVDTVDVSDTHEEGQPGGDNVDW